MKLPAQRIVEIWAEGEARTFNTARHTFLTQRFDRTGTGGRIHFASAMTLPERATQPSIG